MQRDFVEEIAIGTGSLVASAMIGARGDVTQALALIADIKDPTSREWAARALMRASDKLAASYKARMDEEAA